MRRLPAILAVMLLAFATSASAQNDDRKAARERELARRAQAQAQKAESEKAQLQSENAQLQKDKADLEQKAKAAAQLRRQVDDARRREQAVEKDMSDLRDRLAKAEARGTEQGGRIEALGRELAAARGEGERLATQLEAVTRERDAALASSEERRLAIATLEEKNLVLYGLANDLATRYQRKGVWDALLQREPVTGIKDVRTQALMQEYRDKAEAQRAVAPGTGR